MSMKMSRRAASTLPPSSTAVPVPCRRWRACHWSPSRLARRWPWNWSSHFSSIRVYLSTFTPSPPLPYPQVKHRSFPYVRVRLSCTTHPHPLPHTPTLTNHFRQSIRGFWLFSPAWINVLFTRKRDRHRNNNKDPFPQTLQQYLWTTYPSISSDRNPSLHNTLQKGKQKNFSNTDGQWKKFRRRKPVQYTQFILRRSTGSTLTTMQPTTKIVRDELLKTKSRATGKKRQIKKKSHWERWHTEESPTPWIPKCYSLPVFYSRGEQSNKLNSGPGHWC
jgi:hypothetical protein